MFASLAKLWLRVSGIRVVMPTGPQGPLQTALGAELSYLSWLLAFLAWHSHLNLGLGSFNFSSNTSWDQWSASEPGCCSESPGRGEESKMDECNETVTLLPMMG